MSSVIIEPEPGHRLLCGLDDCRKEKEKGLFFKKDCCRVVVPFLSFQLVVSKREREGEEYAICICRVNSDFKFFGPL